MLKFDDNKIDFSSVLVNSYFASVCADFIRHELLKSKISFTFETVMSSEDKVGFLKKAQNLMDITNSILKNSKRELVKKNNTEIIAVDDNFIQIKAGSFMMGSDEYEREQPIHKVR